MIEMDMTTQSINAIVSFILTGQNAHHVPYEVSLVVIVGLGNSIPLIILVMQAQEHLLLSRLSPVWADVLCVWELPLQPLPFWQQHAWGNT